MHPSHAHRPTDAAIESFLKDMGLTVDEFKKRPALAKQLVAQHTLLNSNGEGCGCTASGLCLLPVLTAGCQQTVPLHASMHPVLRQA